MHKIKLNKCQKKEYERLDRLLCDAMLQRMSAQNELDKFAKNIICSKDKNKIFYGYEFETEFKKNKAETKITIKC